MPKPFVFQTKIKERVLLTGVQRLKTVKSHPRALSSDVLARNKMVYSF